MTRRCFNRLTLALWFAAQNFLRADATIPSLARSVILENNVVYLRVATVGKNLPEEISAAQSALAATNKPVGTVLDLRFAGGDDPAAAAATTKLFAEKKTPLAVLVNNQTREAAVTLAGGLRVARAGLIFGGVVAEVRPDIAVAVDAADERAYFTDAWTNLVRTNFTAATNVLFSPTNRPFHRVSEADLVRARRSGVSDPEGDEENIPVEAVPEPRVVRDPVLARALDLLRGLALLRRD